MMLKKYIDIILSGSERTVIIKKNIIGSLAVKGFSILIQLMLVPITIGYINSELYGVWLTLSSIVLWLNFFDIGFTLGLKNKLAEAIALGDWDRGKTLVSTTYILMTIIFVPLCILMGFILPRLDWHSLLNVNEIYTDDIVTSLYILIICFCLQMIVNVLTTVISAFQKVALANLIGVSGNALTLIAIFFLKQYVDPSLPYLALAVASMPVIMVLVASGYMYSHDLQKVSPSLILFDKNEVKNLFNLGAKFFIIQIQVVVLYQTTNILISNVSSPLEVTNYNIAYKYLGIAMMVFSIILQPLWPAFTDAYTKKDYNWMNKTYRKMSLLYAASLLAILIMVIISPFVYRIWVNGQVDVPIMMTLIVALYMAIHSWDSLQVLLINGIGTVKLQAYVTCIGIIVHIPLSLLLGNYFGAIGVVVSMTLVDIIYATIFTIQIRKLLNNTASGIWLK